MKRIILLFIVVFISCIVVAKPKFGIDLGVGIKGGLNLNKMTGLGLKQEFHTDPHGGFFVFLNKRSAGVQLEAVWTQNHITTDSSFKGLYQQYLNQANDSLNAASFKFNTISLPFLLNIKLTQFLWIQLGPQFSANISVADKSEIVKSGLNIIAQQNYSAVGGLWFQFGGKAPLIRVNAGARYVVGLTNINSLSPNTEWQNQMLQLHIGLSY
jgi:hypothetical protein